MDVLLIESDALHRVSVAHHLSRSGHRVTISSAIEEAREILQFIRRSSEAPDVVAIAEGLLSSDSTCFRNEIADRFPHAAWIPLPANLSLRWLVDSLHKEATRTAPQNSRSISRFQHAPRIPERERAHLLVVQGDRDNFDGAPEARPRK
jgi:DNA-binding NarL/FixJ family response regulator